MPTLDSESVRSLPEVVLQGRRLVESRRSEWVLTNALGGFAMGTVAGTPERRYHALLVAATLPPVGRVAALQAVDECLLVESAGPAGCAALRRYRLTPFKWGGVPEPDDALPTGLARFAARGASVRWDFRPLGKSSPPRVGKELTLLHERHAALIRYEVASPNRRAWLELRPLVSLRDFHDLQVEAPRGAWSVEADEDDIVEVRAGPGLPALRLGVAGARFVREESWWRNFEYRRDLLRGQAGVESLFCPGAFVVECHPARGGGQAPARPRGVQVELAAWADDGARPAGFDAWRARSRRRVAALADACVEHWHPGAGDARALRALTAAADQFVVRREPRRPSRPSPRANPPGVSIIAGYPWFSDWGRDTMISLPGLLLCTRRFEEARATLEAFAALRRRGLIPNCFDDGTGSPQYNTVDASLWFVQAACAYLEETEDRQGFSGEIRSACLDVVEAYRSGTDFSIRVDPADGLVAAGDETTQLTWMDAKRDGVVFTPRHGKPVEINALWCSGLSRLALAVAPELPGVARELREAASRAGASFAERYWNERDACLYDLLSPVGGADEPVASVRPNQVFAVSLPHSPLPPARQRQVLERVRRDLLTPMGLRTLAPHEPGYRPWFEGPLFERDGAYHNGTVWPWLIGPYAEGLMRVGDFSRDSRARAREAITPLLGELLGQAAPEPQADRPSRVASPSVLTLCEVYDADETPTRPRRGDGCMAQAWSIAELLRVLTLTLREGPR